LSLSRESKKRPGNITGLTTTAWIKKSMYEAAGRVRNICARIAETETGIRRIQADAALTTEKKAVKNQCAESQAEK